MYQAVIVDDEPHTVKDLVHAIDWSGFQLEVGCAATDPVKALHYILSNPVSLVITDIAMPNMDGLELIQRIKEAKPHIYMVVLSAYNNFEYARTALRYGAENYLLKPIDSNELSDTISQIASHIQVREQLNSTYGQAMLTFRNAFTEQWAKNLLGNNEFSTKARLLGINLEAPCFTAVVFSCTRGTPAHMSKFFELLLRNLPGQYAGNFFFETPTRLVGVLSPAEHKSREICDFIRQLLRDAASDRIQVFASAGSSVSHYSDVYLSYSQADSHTWLEHTGIPCFFYRKNSALESAAEAALKEYEQSFGENTDKLRKLFIRNQPFICALSLLTLRFRNLCSEEYRLSEDFPEVCRLLARIPSSSQDPHPWIRYTLEILKESDELVRRMKQSMYPCVDAVLKSVHEFTDKDISLKTLAARLNVSSSYLGTIFHQQTGYYFNDYLSEVRLKKAAELLESTDMKIKDIVEQTGFSSQPYFTRSFKRYFNTSPANYRRDKNIENL